ncbi:hypothetical protein HWA86_gp02 [Pseudoalteromonas phage HP1]|jgi:hypothetical protein|uniref:hypothetical protein n=1 Tax=Pseudoalteromonas phage HP1 TaxID=1357706 RepID=UPI0018AF66C1|nr:hypothetical protein HWA86_gp02 [Pseudoalteromonas phage HP1]
MALNINNAPKSSGKVSPIPEADTHRAVVIEVIGLGLQDCGSWKGEKKPNKVKIRLTYELPDQTAEFDGETKPLIVSEEINFSNHEKSDLVARFNQLDPTNEFKGDITKLLGKSCLVTVSHRVGTGKFAGRTFANIAAVSALPKILPKVEEIFNPLVSYDPDEPDAEVFASLPEFMQTKINNRLDAPHNAVKQEVKEEEDESDIPSGEKFETPDVSGDW